jgi:hypothetical protein
MHEPRFERLRVLSCRTAPHSGGFSHDQRHARLSAKHIADFGRLVHELVHGTKAEIDHPQIGDGSRAGNRCSYGSCHDCRFGNWRVDDALRSELVDQAVVLKCTRASMRGTKVFAQGPNQLVAAHLFGQALSNGIGVGHFRHCGAPTS